jgi:hypothetical protein
MRSGVRLDKIKRCELAVNTRPPSKKGKCTVYVAVNERATTVVTALEDEV